MRLRRLNSWMAVTIASRFVFALVNRIASARSLSGILTVVFMIPFYRYRYSLSRRVGILPAHARFPRALLRKTVFDDRNREVIDLALLLQEVLRRRFVGFFLQRRMHTHVPTVLLRVARLRPRPARLPVYFKCRPGSYERSSGYFGYWRAVSNRVNSSHARSHEIAVRPICS
jgi:hypothetical protein